MARRRSRSRSIVRRPSPLRRAAGWLALFALLFQASVPLWHVPPTARLDPAIAIHVALGHMPAPQAGTRTGDGDTKDDGGDRPPAPYCPICQALHQAADMPRAVAVALPQAIAATALAERAAATPAVRQARPHSARDPPLPA